MSTLGAMSHAWVSAQAALPLGWRVTGLMLFGDEWVAFSNGSGTDDHVEGSGRYAEEALRRLAERLREIRGSVLG